MALHRESNFDHHSPRSSSGGAESLHGTPDTRLSAFSPKNGSTQSSKHCQTLSDCVLENPSLKFPAHRPQSIVSSSFDKDPFVVPRVATHTVLSPTASTFSPNNVTGFFEPSVNGSPTEIPSRNLRVRSPGLRADDLKHWLKNYQSTSDSVHGRQYTVTTHEDSIYVHFADIGDACAVQSLMQTNEKEWHVEFIHSIDMASDHPFDSVVKTGSAAIAEVRQGPDTPNLFETFRSKWVIVYASVQSGSFANAEQLTGIVHKFMASHGQMVSFSVENTPPGLPHVAMAEFVDYRVAESMFIKYAGGFIIKGVNLLLTFARGIDGINSSMISSLSSINLADNQDKLSAQRMMLQSEPIPRETRGQTLKYTQPHAYFPLVLQPPQAATTSFVQDQYISPGIGHLSTTESAVTSPLPVVGSLFRTPPSPALTIHPGYGPSRTLTSFSRPDYRRSTASRVVRSPFHTAASHHNHVEISRIREGTDVRTTIMLRNIPNKVDQVMLKRIVDESSWGKYDFMYLRIDFANDCNVGYAFINFVDPLDIIDFVDARGNQRWNCFKSDKVAEISYATIQGKDCLVQKFRNSSVMLEAPHYRPKLYFTSNGPVPGLAGQEESFPEPDNQSKMKRSCENAEHVGLFTPNAGQYFRDEQRRRRSQYDRGTRLAALEEYDYDSAIQQISGRMLH